MLVVVVRVVVVVLLVVLVVVLGPVVVVVVEPAIVVVVVPDDDWPQSAVTAPLPSSATCAWIQSLSIMFCRLDGSATQVLEPLALATAAWNFVSALEMHGGASVGSPAFAAFAWQVSSPPASLPAAFSAPAGHAPVPGIAAPTSFSQASALFSHAVMSPEQGPRASALAKAGPNLPLTLVSHGAWDAESFLAATLERQLRSPDSFLLTPSTFPRSHFAVSWARGVAPSSTMQAGPPTATPITVLDMARSLLDGSERRAKHFFLHQSLASGREDRRLDVRESEAGKRVRGRVGGPPRRATAARARARPGPRLRGARNEISPCR